MVPLPRPSGFATSSERRQRVRPKARPALPGLVLCGFVLTLVNIM